MDSFEKLQAYLKEECFSPFALMIGKSNGYGGYVACRAEAGNIKYDYYMADADADELFLLEKWKDADALTEHTKQTHYIRLGDFKQDYVTDTIVEKYEIKE